MHCPPHSSRPPEPVPPTGDAVSGVHARLREGTRDAHGRLEATLGLTGADLTRARYRAVLARFFGFWVAWEPAVALALDEPGFLAPRRRTELLVRDLVALGLAKEAVAALPRCTMPALAGPAAALGSLYVLEGSTLGGRVLTRAFAMPLGLPEGAPGSLYFTGYGAATGAMWAAFRARLLAAPDDWADGMLGGALATFATLEGWLAPVGIGASPASLAAWARPA